MYVAISDFLQTIGSKTIWIAVDYTNIAGEMGWVVEYLNQNKIRHLVSSSTAQQTFEKIGDYMAEMRFTLVDVGMTVQLAESIANRTETVFFREDQAGFLVGVLAASVSKNGHVGVVAGTSLPSVRNFRNGFHKGATYASPSCVVEGAYLPSFYNTTAAIILATELVARGSDVIWGVGGAAATAAIEAVADAAVVIGVDSDQFLTLFLGQNTSKSRKIISSAIKSADTGSLASVRRGVAGQFSAGTRVLGVAEGGVYLAPCHLACEYVSEKTTAQLEAVRSALRSGLSTGVDPSCGDSLTTSAGVFSFERYGKVTWGTAVITANHVVYVLDSNWTRSIWRDPHASTFDFQRTPTWTQALLPAPRHNFSAAGVSLLSALTTFSDAVTFVVAFGGITDQSTLASGDLWMLRGFLCDSGKLCNDEPYWSAVPLCVSAAAVPPSRTLHSMSSHNDTLYVFGGQGSQQKTLGDTWNGQLLWAPSGALCVYWVEQTPSKFPRHSHASALWVSPDGWQGRSSRRYLVVAGGVTAQSTALLQLFDTKANEWLPPVYSDAKPRIHPCVVPLRQRIWIVGGDESSEVLVFPVQYSPLKLIATNVSLLSQPLVGPLSCTVAAAATVSLLHSDAEREAAASNVLTAVSRLPQTTSVKVALIPSISCDSSRGLALRMDGSKCEYCPDGLVVLEECELYARARDSSDGKSHIFVFVIVPTAFAIGVAIGFVVWRYFVASKKASADKNAPKLPCALGLVKLNEAPEKWVAESQRMGEALQAFFDCVEQTIEEQQLYEVRSVGDGFLVAASTTKQMLDFVRLVCDKLPKNPKIASMGLFVQAGLHFGSPIELTSDTTGRDYIGVEADTVIALGNYARQREVLCTAPFHAALPSDEQLGTNLKTENIPGLTAPLTFLHYQVEQPLAERLVTLPPSTHFTKEDEAELKKGIPLWDTSINSMPVDSTNMEMNRQVAEIVRRMLRGLTAPFSKEERRAFLKGVLSAWGINLQTANDRLEKDFAQAAVACLQRTDIQQLCEYIVPLKKRS